MAVKFTFAVNHDILYNLRRIDRNFIAKPIKLDKTLKSSNQKRRKKKRFDQTASSRGR